MSSIPRVAEVTRERVSREFDDRGPEACLAEISRDLSQSNPELLDMARKCARDVGEPARILTGFCMFYRLLVVRCLESLRNAHGSGRNRERALLPRVTPDTRDFVARRIDSVGPEAFTREAVEELRRSNPELLQMAHNFASEQPDYLGTLQGFALIYAALVAQCTSERTVLH